MKCISAAAWTRGLRAVGGLTMALMAALTVASAHAAWPDKPLQIIVAYPPGGLTDALRARLPSPCQSA